MLWIISIGFTMSFQFSLWVYEALVERVKQSKWMNKLKWIKQLKDCETVICSFFCFNFQLTNQSNHYFSSSFNCEDNSQENSADGLLIHKLWNVRTCWLISWASLRLLCVHCLSLSQMLQSHVSYFPPKWRMDQEFITEISYSGSGSSSSQSFVTWWLN